MNLLFEKLLVFESFRDNFPTLTGGVLTVTLTRPHGDYRPEADIIKVVGLQEPPIHCDYCV